MHVAPTVRWSQFPLGIIERDGCRDLPGSVQNTNLAAPPGRASPGVIEGVPPVVIEWRDARPFEDLPAAAVRFDVDDRVGHAPDSFESDEAPRNDNLSWEDAVEEAGKWLGSLRLGRRLDGQTVDLVEAAKTLAFEGRFRQMIFESVRRKLKKRGARDVILPPE